MVNHVTIDKFKELTGYTRDAVQSKIKRGQWVEGREFKKAPDGRILIYLPGFEAWVNGQAEFAPHEIQSR